MGNFPTNKEHYIPYLVVACISIVVFLLGDVATHYIEFSREQVNNMQWWRLVSAHFAHTNGLHLLFNLVGLALLWMLHGEYTKASSFAFTFFILTLAVSIGVLLFSTHLNTYVGLSGVLHGLFAWGVVQDIKLKRKSGYLLLVGLLLKIGEEQFFKSTALMDSLIQASVAIDAHLYGAITGLVLGMLIQQSNIRYLNN